jgi:hypothetical protein
VQVKSNNFYGEGQAKLVGSGKEVSMYTKPKKPPKGTDRIRYTQIAVYAPPPLYNQIAREGVRRRRKLGPTCLEIIREYFEKKEAALAVEKAS